MSNKVFHNGTVQFDDIILVPIVLVTIIVLFATAAFSHSSGYRKGKEAAANAISRDCDRAYGSFTYRAKNGELYFFDCSFKSKSEKKPWDE